MNTRRATVSLVVLLTAFAGCRQPSDVELDASTPESPSIEVTPIAVSDSGAQASAWLDSTIVLPQDQNFLGGHLVINRVTHDTGSGKATFAMSEVFFADSAVSFMGRQWGYAGRDLETVQLNGEGMIRVPHLVRIRLMNGRDTVLVRGVRYLANLTGSYTPGRVYRWTASPFGMGQFSASVQAPGALIVRAPVGGTIVRRDRDLGLRWEGTDGEITVIVSHFDRLSRRSRPILSLRPRANIGQMIIPATLLRGLPREKQVYVLSFVLTRRSDGIQAGQYGRRVFAQAADIYHSYIALQ